MNDDDLRRALDDLVSPLPPLGALPTGTATRVRRRRAAKLAGSGALAVALLSGGIALALPGSDPERLEPPVVASGGPSATAVPTPQPSSAASPAAPVPSAQPSTSPSCEAECGEQLRTSLQPDGLGVLTLPSGSNRMLLFGEATGDQVRTALGAALGDVQENALPDCGAQVVQLTYGDAVIAFLDDDVLVGWSVDADGPRLTTGDGIAAGSSLDELRAAYPSVEVTDGSLGREFSVPGGYYGTLDGETVAVLAAGNACFFR